MNKIIIELKLLINDLINNIKNNFTVEPIFLENFENSKHLLLNSLEKNNNKFIKKIEKLKHENLILEEILLDLQKSYPKVLNMNLNNLKIKKYSSFPNLYTNLTLPKLKLNNFNNKIEINKEIINNFSLSLDFFKNFHRNYEINTNNLLKQKINLINRLEKKLTYNKKKVKIIKIENEQLLKNNIELKINLGRKNIINTKK